MDNASFAEWASLHHSLLEGILQPAGETPANPLPPVAMKKPASYGGQRGAPPLGVSPRLGCRGQRLLANRNALRVCACPSCGKSVSTNGHNFSYHLKACNPDMFLRTVPAEQLEKFRSNGRKIALEKMAGLSLDGEIKPGANVAAVLEVGVATEMGHHVRIHAPDGRVMVGFVFDIGILPSADKDMARASDACFGM